jgi:pyridoxamine-phosphate oxidase
MSLATVDGHGLPDVRVVLLKGHDARGFVFYTNYEGAKGVQLSVRPYAALGVHWKTLQRQVRVRGPVSRVSAEESDAYFATRPRESQLSAWASEQSRPLDARETFEARLAAANARFPGAVPRPPFWAASGWASTRSSCGRTGWGASITGSCSRNTAVVGKAPCSTREACRTSGSAAVKRAARAAQLP